MSSMKQKFIIAVSCVAILLSFIHYLQKSITLLDWPNPDVEERNSSGSDTYRTQRDTNIDDHAQSRVLARNYHFGNDSGSGKKVRNVVPSVDLLNPQTTTGSAHGVNPRERILLIVWAYGYHYDQVAHFFGTHAYTRTHTHTTRTHTHTPL